MACARLAATGAPNGGPMHLLPVGKPSLFGVHWRRTGHPKTCIRHLASVGSDVFGGVGLRRFVRRLGPAADSVASNDRECALQVW